MTTNSFVIIGGAPLARGKSFVNRWVPPVLRSSGCENRPVGSTTHVFSCRREDAPLCEMVPFTSSQFGRESFRFSRKLTACNSSWQLLRKSQQNFGEKHTRVLLSARRDTLPKNCGEHSPSVEIALRCLQPILCHNGLGRSQQLH